MCLRPITLRNKSSPFKAVHSIQVPCGKCDECLKSYQNSWFVRFFWESKQHSKACFVTLTYDNSSAPTLIDSDGVVYLTVYKKHIQDWLKRFRKKCDIPFKYYCTSEYGPSTFRPHYHLCFWGLDHEDLQPALSDWNSLFGFTTARDVNLFDKKDVSNTMRYIAKYCNKADMDYSAVSEKKVFPTFHLMSKGIGSNYLSQQKFHLYGLEKEFTGKDYSFTSSSLARIFEKSKVNIDGFEYSLPRYYKTKIYGQKNQLSSQMSDFILRRSDDLYNQKLQKLQAENLSDSAFRLLDLSNRYDSDKSSEKIKKANSKFYNKSKI